MTKITVELDYVKVDTDDFISDRTTPHEQLQRVYDTYNKVHGTEYTYGRDRTCEEFLAWLTARGVEVSGYGGDGPWSGWTGNSQNMLTDDFGYCLFTAFGTAFLAVEADNMACRHAPEFYEITADDMTDVLDFDKGRVWCEGEPGHVFYTENAGYKWYVDNDGAMGDQYKMERAWDAPWDLQMNDAWQCPLCPAHIREGNC